MSKLKANEFEVMAKLQGQRKDIKSFNELVSLLKEIESTYNYDYGVAPRAIAQASLAVANYLAREFGITGFQAGCVMWDFIRDWLYSRNKCGLRILDYDNMLYPQCADRFTATIDKEVWELLQKTAKEKLEQSEYAHPDVIEHWQSIVDGKVPFGYRVGD